MASLTVTREKSLGSPAPQRFAIVLVLGLILLGVCVTGSLAFGSKVMGLKQLTDGLFHADVDAYLASVMQQRIARTVFSIVCGGALGVAGALMQAVTRNPIADPSILGVNTGAALFVVAGIAFLNIGSSGEFIALACSGAALTAIFVFGIGSLGRGGATPIKLVLAGAATSAALASLINAIMIPRTRVMDQFRFWQAGSVGSGNWDDIAAFAPILIVGMLVAFAAAPALNALALGDEAATGLGVRTGVLRLIASAAGVLLCGTVTALAGPIGFVGLMATHVVRLMIGPDQRYLIPMSALSGAIVLTLSDVVGRIIGRPGELEAGIVTAFIGAPILIILALKSKVRSL